MLLAALLIGILAVAALLSISFIINFYVRDDGYNLEISIILAHAVKLFRWDLKEGGLKFLIQKKKQADQGKKKQKKRWLSETLQEVFNPKSILNVKRMRFLKLEVKGRIATRDAALTAMTYGSVCSVIAILLPFVDQQKSQFDFYPDFDRTNPDFNAACIIRVRIIHIIYLLGEGLADKYLKGRWRKYGPASY